ncbi:MAG TPA: glycine cleavage system aminomethyltransferase GcvT [Bacillota bacterium]
MNRLKRTPLFPEYATYGAKTIDFGGWDMPVQFTGIKHEHETTRTKAGLFDVSHMGEIRVSGPKSLPFLQKMVTNDVSKLSPKRIQYTLMCNENGGTIDDFLIYMIEEDHYLLVVNASNTDKDYEWLQKHNAFASDEVVIENVSENYALLALQGPLAEEILQSITDTPLNEIVFFRFEKDVLFSTLTNKALVSRTGYTGEDGFEIYIDPQEVRKLWNLILEVGEEKGVIPVGLGARDTLRFEANLPLYGQELSEYISPIEAGLTFAVKVDKETRFIGQEKLREQIINGPDRKLVAIEMVDRGIPRTGYDVYNDQDEKIGFITSGTHSPTLRKNIGLALINNNDLTIGTKLLVHIRKRKLKAVIVDTPFLQEKNK